MYNWERDEGNDDAAQFHSVATDPDGDIEQEAEAVVQG